MTFRAFKLRPHCRPYITSRSTLPIHISCHVFPEAATQWRDYAISPFSNTICWVFNRRYHFTHWLIRFHLTIWECFLYDPIIPNIFFINILNKELLPIFLINLNQRIHPIPLQSFSVQYHRRDQDRRHRLQRQHRRAGGVEPFVGSSTRRPTMLLSGVCVSLYW